MIPAIIVFLYLAIVLYVGIFAFRKAGAGKEDFFVANRSLGTFVFLLSLFGSNMTSFAILGSSGLAFRQGIGVFGLMASISGLVIPTSIFLIGTRLWAIGKRFGHITQVQILRDRFEMGHIGTVLFALQAIMLLPYIIIGVMGGGETLEGVSGGAVPYEVGGLVVALVVMSYVFFGGMRGTAWVNTLQTLMFLVFGTLAFIVIARGMGGLGAAVNTMAGSLDKATEVAATQPNPAVRTPLNTPMISDGALLTRHRIQFWYYASYMLIPLSSIMFPHIAIFCLTAKKLVSFKRTVILYPLCILAVWLPSVFLGAMAGGQPKIVAQMAVESDEAKSWWAAKAGTGSPDIKLVQLLLSSSDPAGRILVDKIDASTPGWAEPGAMADRLSKIKDPKVKAELRRLANTNADGVMLIMLNNFAPAFLAGILGAAIMACVMASDSQILALSTMFSEDVFAFYGHKDRFGEKAQIWAARVFVVLMTLIAYGVAISIHQYANIFEVAIQFAFSGYASLAPIMIGCLFWKRATKWGVLASTLWVALFLAFGAALQFHSNDIAPTVPGGFAPIKQIWGIPLTLGDRAIFFREATRVSFSEARVLLVAPMFIGAALLMFLVSLATRPPSQSTIDRYFPPRTPGQ